MLSKSQTLIMILNFLCPFLLILLFNTTEAHLLCLVVRCTVTF